MRDIDSVLQMNYVLSSPSHLCQWWCTVSKNVFFLQCGGKFSKCKTCHTGCSHCELTSQPFASKTSFLYILIPASQPTWLALDVLQPQYLYACCTFESIEKISPWPRGHPIVSSPLYPSSGLVLPRLVRSTSSWDCHCTHLAAALLTVLQHSKTSGYFRD